MSSSESEIVDELKAALDEALKTALPSDEDDSRLVDESDDSNDDDLVPAPVPPGFVTIRHDGIDATAAIPEAAVKAHEARGWKRVTDDDSKDDDETEPTEADQ